ncbi:hypothetical protein ABT010_13310 [Streptomyces sp. NPDC002668]|uniref:hypothetical protein n=1 Tax=Streptomyces sp. NPDC002668 TaxID=3154422 RepID=UPI00332186DD
MTVNGVRPACGPAVARITHHHRGTTQLCQPCLDSWFNSADGDESLEPLAFEPLTA